MSCEWVLWETCQRVGDVSLFVVARICQCVPFVLGFIFQRYLSWIKLTKFQLRWVSVKSFNFPTKSKHSKHVLQELDIIYRIPHAVPISAHHKWNFDDLLEKMWDYLSLTRMYSTRSLLRIWLNFHLLSFVAVTRNPRVNFQTTQLPSSWQRQGEERLSHFVTHYTKESWENSNSKWARLGGSMPQ